MTGFVKKKTGSMIGLASILKSFFHTSSQQQAARTVYHLSPVSLLRSNQTIKEQEGKEFTKVDKSAHWLLLLYVEEIDMD